MKILLTYAIATVWLLNGLFCKVLNIVPRHEMIIGRILGEEYSNIITKIIGVLEILMAVWVISKIKSRWCAYVQIVIVINMNIIEALLAPDLLLFGRLNLLFAFLFASVIYWNEFYVTSLKHDK
jgi:hypothetical protein